MEQALPTTILAVFAEFLATNPTPQAILDYEFPEAIQARATFLSERSSEGRLTYEEEQQIIDFVRVDKLLRLLKAKTLLNLKNEQN